MSENTEGATSSLAGTGRSRRWLVAAVLATLAAAVVLVSAFVGLGRIWADEPVSREPIGAETMPSLSVAVARTPGGPTEWSNWARVIKYLSEELERPVTVRYISKEEEAVDIIKGSDVDLAFICAHQYLDLRDEEVIAPLCTPVMDGSTTTRAMLVVAADDPAGSFEDLEGSVVAASDKSSLGGYAYLRYLSAERGVDPLEFFAEVRLGESQEQNMSDLLAGEVRATIINSVQALAWDTSGLKAIEESPPYGCPPVVVRADMSAEDRGRILDLLLAFDPEHMLPEDSAIDGFEPLDDAEYAFAELLRDACGHHEHP